MSKKITIVGAGLAGSLLAIYLAEKGFTVDMYERRPDLRIHDAGAGKSINLALSARGIHALTEIGLYDEIKAISIPMYGRMIHQQDSSTMFQAYGRDNSEYINAVSRSELNKKLYDLAEAYDNVKIYFSHRCTGVNLESNVLYFHNDATGENISLTAEHIISTDGATSAVRYEMQKVPRFNFSQEYENYGYKELVIPAGGNGLFQIEKNALHIWPRGSFMLIALPNIDGSFTCTLFIAYDKSLGGENSFEHLSSKDRVGSFFNSQFPDAVKIMPEMLDDFFTNPTGSLMTVKCYPYAYKDKILLLGDAAHAIVPFFGQGMNAAFEDCSYLSTCIDRHGDNWVEVFSDFQEHRKPNSDAIADLAQENFVEMRDLVARPDFQLRKKIEAELQKRFPGKFVPKYSMVTFNRIPYSVALERGKLQEKILMELSGNINDIKDVNWEKAAVLVNDSMSEMQ